MTVRDPGRIPVGLFEGARISDDAVLRLSTGASRIVAFADAAEAPAITAQWSRVAPAIEVDVVPAVSDIREAIIECARRKVIWVAAPTPKNAARFVAGALQGAAAATEFEIPSVAVHVLRDDTVEGSVAWLTQTGEMSGYGVLYAAAVAAMGGRSVTLISPTAVRAPRTPEALEAAERYIEQSGVEILRLSDPSPLQRVLGGEFGAVVHPVLDAPGGRSLLHPGELPAKSIADGNAAAVVELIERAPGDVIAVFDGVRLVYGSGTAARIAASVALGVTALAGVGAVAAPAALAAPLPAAAASAPAATGNTAVVRSTMEDVLSHLAFPHSGAGTTLQITNTSGHSVTVRVTGFHGHGGSAGAHETVTIQPGQTVTVQAPTGGIKQWSDAAVTAIDGQHVPPLAVMTGGTPVPLSPQTIQHLLDHANVPREIPVTGTVETVTGHGPVTQPQGHKGKTVKGHSAVPQTPTATPVPTPQQVPTPTPTATPQPQPQSPNLVPPKQVPTPTPHQVPEAIPPITQQTPGQVPQVPDQVPTAIPQATPQSVPDLATPTPGTGTQTPGGGQVTTSTTGTGTTTPGTIDPGTATHTTHSGTTHAATHPGAATHQARSTTGGPTGTQTAGGPSELAHTGAGETGLLAGLAAALMAAGAGIVVAARRSADDREEELGDVTS
jgi:hypothetical protein